MYFIINLSGSQQFSGSSIQNEVELSEWATGRFMHCHFISVYVWSFAVSSIIYLKAWSNALWPSNKHATWSSPILILSSYSEIYICDLCMCLGPTKGPTDVTEFNTFHTLADILVIFGWCLGIWVVPWSVSRLLIPWLQGISRCDIEYIRHPGHDLNSGVGSH